MLSGNVVADLEPRKTGTGKSVVNVRMAVSGNTEKDESLFIDVVVWDQQADFATKYFKKGSRIFAIGRLQSRKYEKDGQTRTVVEVVADSIGFDGPPAKKEGEEATAKTAAPKTDTAPATRKTASKPNTSDDLPF